ncbi:MAG: hypothetical protein U5L09_03260, partial [Bacteroidales bacterium]|nr:hypothetical protein [Bacteroidales bacterium]
EDFTLALNDMRMWISGIGASLKELIAAINAIRDALHYSGVAFNSRIYKNTIVTRVLRDGINGHGGK